MLLQAREALLKREKAPALKALPAPEEPQAKKAKTGIEFVLPSKAKVSQPSVNPKLKKVLDAANEIAAAMEKGKSARTHTGIHAKTRRPAIA